jgi:hypothetical protein
MTDSELKELVASLAIAQRETTEQFKETDRRLKESSVETDRRLKELWVETDRILKELALESAAYQRETAEQFRETAEQFRETAEQFKETDRRLKELGKQIGGLGDKFGSFTEGMAFPSMTKILQETFKMKHISPNHITKSNGSSLELDVFAYNDELKIACIVEVKSHLKAEGIRQLVDILRKFPKFFPNHRDSELYGILAFVKADKGVDEIVLKSGIYLADIHDEHFRLQVPEGFKARNFQAIKR